jgi:hypothetical protein
MQTLDAHPLTDLVGRLDRVRAALPTVPVPVPRFRIPIPFPPPHPAVTTALIRGTTTFGYVITPGLHPAPTGPNVVLTSGTLWFLANQLGAPFAATPGFVGIPFSRASMHVTGNVTFAPGTITLDAIAALRFDVASAITPITGPSGDPIGADFLAAKLTPTPHASIAFAPSGASIGLAGNASGTLYGQAVTLEPLAAAPLQVDFTTPHVALPCKVDQPTFKVGHSASNDFRIDGTAPVVSGGVVFPIIDAAPNALPNPADAWGIIVVTGAGLTARFGTLTKPQPLAGSSFALTPARLVGLVATGAARIHQRYALWKTPARPLPPPPTRPPLALPESEIIFDSAGGSLIAFSATPSEELVLTPGALDARVDRPIGADGARIVLQGQAVLSQSHTATAMTIDVLSTLTPKAPSSIALIARNALIPVGTPDAFLLTGTLQNDRISGTLEIGFPTGIIIPTFPDPYAARYVAAPAQEQVAGVVAKVDWTPTTPPVLTLEVVPAKPAGTVGTAGAVQAAQTTAPLATTFAFIAPSAAEARGGLGFALLDVSTHADQWGLAVTFAGVSHFAFDRLQLNAPSPDTFVFTVPGISWEPVVDATAGVPQWLAAFAPSDGTPTTFLVPTSDPAPLVPLLALLLYQQQAAKLGSLATFTLPFGITAKMADTRQGGTGPSYAIPSATFTGAGLTTAHALSIRGVPVGGDPLTATLPGTTDIGFNGSASSGYGSQVLGLGPTIPMSPAFFWDSNFGPAGSYHGTHVIPVGRVDLAGYGTSTFSDWHDPLPNDVGVVRALFNVLLGRTAHELVTLQTWIVPWSIRLQRTITFDRDDAGEVIKHDTGWKAVAEGKFELLPGAVLTGPVLDLINVRNIAFSDEVVTVVSGDTRKYTPCTFDADVVFGNGLFIAADGANPAKTAVGTTIQGYASEPDPVDNPSGLAPTAPEIIALMQQQKRVVGTVHCIARIGGSADTQFALNVTSFGAAVAAGTPPKLQTAIFGTPRLPKDGQWSIARRAASAARPQPIDPATPVPFTLGLPSAKPPPTNAGTFASGFRLLDPEDAQNVDNPQTFYGVLQGTGSSKTFLEHPLVNDAGQALGFGNVPKLADVGSLLGIGDIFPDIGNVLQIPSTDGLPLNAEGFKKTYDWPAQGQPYSNPDRSLLDIAIVHLLLSYSAPNPADPTNSASDLPFHGELVLDANPSAPKWSLTLNNLSFKAKVDGFGNDPLLTVAGGFQAGSSIKPGFIGPTSGPPGLQVYYGSALSAVQSLFSGLSDLAKSLGGDADLDVGFSGQTLSVRQGFTLPSIPLGFGEITHLGIDLGFSATIPSDLAFHVGIGSKKDPFQWVVSPLAGNGAIELGVQGGGLAVFIEAGLGLGLSIDVVVASGSASIVVSISLTVATGTITITLMLTGNADIDVLGGLASASLTLSAAISVSFPAALPPPDATLAAQVSVGIHISICWVISIDFDGSWGFSETIALN